MSVKHVTIITIVLISIAAIALVLTGCGAQKEISERYATGETYVVSGHVVKAEEYKPRSHDSSSDESNEKYEVVIETVEEMPDGTHEFKSDQRTTYMSVTKVTKDPEMLVYVMVSPIGKMLACSDEPFTDEDIANATRVTEIRNENVSSHSNENKNYNTDENQNSHLNVNTEKKERDIVNQLNMHKRSEE